MMDNETVVGLSVVACLSFIVNSLIFSTLFKKSMLKLPSNRLLLSLTISNLIFASVVLPLYLTSFRSTEPHHYMNRHLMPTAFPDLDVQHDQNTKDSNSSRNTTYHDQHDTYLHNSTGSGGANEKIKNESRKKRTVFEDNLSDGVRSTKKDKELTLGLIYPPTSAHSVFLVSVVTAITKSKDSSTSQSGVSSRNYIDALLLPIASDSADKPFNKDKSKEEMCEITIFFANLVSTSSSLGVTAIALDRYMAIEHPMMYKIILTRGRTTILLGWCWVQAFATAVLPLVGWGSYGRNTNGWCCVKWRYSPTYSVMWFITVYLLPSCVMLFCYFFILKIARMKSRRIHIGAFLEPSALMTSPEPSLSDAQNVNLTTFSYSPSCCKKGLNGVKDTSDFSKTNRVMDYCDQNKIRPLEETAGKSNLKSVSSSSNLQLPPKSKNHFIKPIWNFEKAPSKGLRTVFIVVSVHLITWSPYSFLAIFETFQKEENSLSLLYKAIAYILLFLSCLLHSIVYGIYNRSIRKELCNCLRRNGRRRRKSKHLSARRCQPDKLISPDSPPIQQWHTRNCSARRTKVPEYQQYFLSPASFSSDLSLRKLSQDSGAVMTSHESSKKPSDHLHIAVTCTFKKEVDHLQATPVLHSLQQHFCDYLKSEICRSKSLCDLSIEHKLYKCVNFKRHKSYTGSKHSSNRTFNQGLKDTLQPVEVFEDNTKPLKNVLRERLQLNRLFLSLNDLRKASLLSRAHLHSSCSAVNMNDEDEGIISDYYF